MEICHGWLFRFLVNLMGYFVIKTSSAANLKVLGSFRNVGLIIVSCIFW
eukprot:UN14979